MNHSPIIILLIVAQFSLAQENKVVKTGNISGVIVFKNDVIPDLTTFTPSESEITILEKNLILEKPEFTDIVNIPNEDLTKFHRLYYGCYESRKKIIYINFFPKEKLNLDQLKKTKFSVFPEGSSFTLAYHVENGKFYRMTSCGN